MPIHSVNAGDAAQLLAGSSCAFGVFDGLHAGHRYLLDQAIASKEGGFPAVALTFDRDPDEVFRPDSLKKLSSNADRIGALAQSGVDETVVFSFDEEFRRLDPAEFLQCAFGSTPPAHMHVGADFRFGAAGAGTVATLQEWGRASGCSVHAHGLVEIGGKPVTATRIRSLLLSCELEEANLLLGHPYTLHATVRKGRGEGTGFGFATANLEVQPHDRVLGEGVYAAYALVGGQRYKAAVSVGVSPTFEARTTANVEVHILDFAGDLVGKDLRVQFVERLRGMVKFDSTEELIAAVTADIEHVRSSL